MKEYSIKKIPTGLQVELFPGTTAKIDYEDLSKVTVITDQQTRAFRASVGPKYITFKKDEGGYWEAPMGVKVPGVAFEPSAFDKLVEAAQKEIVAKK